jgi:hypothetical protein
VANKMDIPESNDNLELFKKEIDEDVILSLVIVETGTIVTSSSISFLNNSRLSFDSGISILFATIILKKKLMKM